MHDVRPRQRPVQVARADLVVVVHAVRAGALARGDLIHMLPGWQAAPARIHAVMPARHGAPLALRRFLDFAAAELPALLARAATPRACRTFLLKKGDLQGRHACSTVRGGGAATQPAPGRGPEL